MYEIDLIILNFLTYEDTYKNIESLYKNIKKNINIDLQIIIVDNNTNEQKYNNLQSKLQKFNFNYKFLYTKNNMGFAKGMNMGIQHSRKKYVICSNNDILYDTKVDFYELIIPFLNNSNIGVIGPNIKTLDNIYQNPYFKDIINWNRYKTKLKNKIFFKYKIGYFLYYLYSIKNEILNKNSINRGNNNQSECVYALHGAYFVLTPSYFKFFSALDSNTFLFSEELILAERIKKVGLCEYFISKIEVLHKEDSSTNQLIFNKWDKLKFIIKENYKSRRYFFKEYIWK